MTAKKRGRPRRVWYRKLRELMAALNVSCTDIGEAIGMSSSTVSRKLCGQVPWTIDEVHRVMEFLQIDPTEMYLYFPKYGEDAESIQQRQIRDYLAETNQSLVPTAALEALQALVGGLAPNGL